jgi:DNA polymerase-3 subunit alpha
MRLAKQLEGLARQTGMHAAGVVISDGPMSDYVPIFTVPGQSGLITQYEMKMAEKVGLVKFDFLGLKTLTVIQRAVDLVRATKCHDFDIAMIPMDDKRVYKLISDGHSVGVFQLESAGMKQLITKLKPSCFEDVVAVMALFRPGPLGSGMVDDFIERKHGRQAIEYPLPQLEASLQETYGVILYQEQVMSIARELAGYSLGEADLLRRAMGK